MRRPENPKTAAADLEYIRKLGVAVWGVATRPKSRCLKMPEYPLRGAGRGPTQFILNVGSSGGIRNYVGRPRLDARESWAREIFFGGCTTILQQGSRRVAKRFCNKCRVTLQTCFATRVEACCKKFCNKGQGMLQNCFATRLGSLLFAGALERFAIWPL